MAFGDYLSWDFMNKPAIGGKPSSGGAPVAPGSRTGDLTTAQKVGSGAQIGTTLLRGIFDEQDARAQRQRDLEMRNAEMAMSFQSRLPELVKLRQDLGNRVSAISALSRMY